MFRPNINAYIPAPDIAGKKKDLYLGFTSIEKGEMISSLQFIGPDFQKFIKSFYESFSEKSTIIFVKNTSEESLINMLSSCLNLIISSLEQPIPLDEYMDILKSRHPNFPGMIKNKDLFVKSFMQAIINTFKNNYNDRIGNLWFKAVTIFVSTVSLFYSS